MRKVAFTGNPVRDAVLGLAGSPYRASGPGEPFRLLVFGGSQGARYFSDAVPPALAGLPDRSQAPLAGHPAVPRRGSGPRAPDLFGQRIAAELATFFDNLPDLMASAQLVIGRAGASSVAELSVIGRPSILVPLPHALDNDQLQNATRLAEGGASWCIEQKDLSPARLAAYWRSCWMRPTGSPRLPLRPRRKAARTQPRASPMWSRS